MPASAAVAQVSGTAPVACAMLRPFFRGPIIAAGGFDAASAEAILRWGDADLVAFGRLFISNPDLPQRLLNGRPLAPYGRDTFYAQGPRGYIDYLGYEVETSDHGQRWPTAVV